MDEEFREPSEHKPFGNRELMFYLSEVNKELRVSASEEIHLLVGGGVAMFSRRPGRLTGDIDVLSEGMTDGLRHAVGRVAERNGLAPDWMNDAAKIFNVALAIDTEPVFRGSHLIVESVGPRYLLAMKLAARRDKDEEDTIHLIRELNIRSSDELMDLMEEALPPPRLLTPAMQYWAMEALDRANKGRRRWKVKQFTRRLLKRNQPLKSATNH